jgi:hypothetical protein
MQQARRVGRAIGALVFLHLATGLMTPYMILQPLSGQSAGAMAVAAGMEDRIRLAVAMLFVGGVIPVAIAITAWSVLRARGPALGQWLLALAAVSLAMQVVENQHYLAQLSLSLEHGRADADTAAVLAAVASQIRAAWRWVHYTHLLTVVGWMLLFCAVLFRLALVPRALAAAGVVTTLMQLGGITLPALLGYRVPFAMEVWGVPLAFAYLGLSLWLLARGFASAPSDTSAYALS